VKSIVDLSKMVVYEIGKPVGCSSKKLLNSSRQKEGRTGKKYERGVKSPLGACEKYFLSKSTKQECKCLCCDVKLDLGLSMVAC
jgi:hypothetical protein